jgi:hypothetical protein
VTRLATIDALIFCILLTPTARAADAHAPTLTHVRSDCHELLDVIAAGVRQSATLDRLVARLNASDVVVYLAFGREPRSGVAAHLSFVPAAGGWRYVGSQSIRSTGAASSWRSSGTSCSTRSRSPTRRRSSMRGRWRGCTGRLGSAVARSARTSSIVSPPFTRDGRCNERRADSQAAQEPFRYRVSATSTFDRNVRAIASQFFSQRSSVFHE